MDINLTRGIYESRMMSTNDARELFQHRLINIMSYMLTILGGEQKGRQFFERALIDYYARDGYCYQENI